MATCSSILTIPGTEEIGRVQSMGGLKESDTTEGLTGHLRNKIEVGLVTRLGQEGIWPEEIWRKQEDKFSGLRVYDSHLHLLSSFKLSLTVLPLLKHVDCVCV